MIRILFTHFVALPVIMASAQCPTGNILISSTAELSSYAMFYGNCDTLPGDLVIFQPQESIDLNAFSNLNMISGDLHLEAIPPGAPDLTGFDQLTHIGGDLRLNSLPAISLTGLGALERIDGDLLVQFVGITNFTGLSSLSVIGGDLEVIFASSLTSLNGLVQLDSIHGDLTITDGIDHPGFTTITLPNDLEYVGGSVHVASAHATTMNGGNSLQRIDGSLHVSGPVLQSVSGLNNLQVIGTDLRFHDLPVLTTINAFNSLDTIHGWFDLIGIPSLTTLTGFPELEMIGGNMWITGNSLVSITGLPQLNTIGTLHLAGNPVLNTITAFDHPILLGHLLLEDNPMLSYCHVQAVCDHLLGGPSTLPNIENNSSGCMSAAEIISFCDISTHLPATGSAALSMVYPNPVTATLQVVTEGRAPLMYVQDTSSRLMISARGTSIDMSTLPPGLYLITIHVGEHVFRHQVVKE